MSKYAVEAVSLTALNALLSNVAQARAQGTLAWTRDKPYSNRGTIEVVTEVVDCTAGQLSIYFVDPRPDRIHINYLFNRVPIRRLDVNDSHRGLPADTTHKHTYLPPSGTLSAYVPTDIPQVPLGPTVAAGTYRAVFEAFALECFIELPPGYWTEPRR